MSSASPAPAQLALADYPWERPLGARPGGRRAKFASFASFTQDVPDPQDPATFERSKLTRRRDDELAALYERLLGVRCRLPPRDADEIDVDEDARWLRVRYGASEVICNFSSARRQIACAGMTVELATHGEPAVADGASSSNRCRGR